MKKIALLERLSNGKFREVLPNEPLVVTAERGAQYALKDPTTGKTPNNMVLRRQGQSLLVLVDDQPTLEISGFFSDGGSNVTFNTDPTTFNVPAAPDSMTPGVITPETPPIVANTEQPILWTNQSNSSSGAILGFDSSSSEALLGGVLVLGGAIIAGESKGATLTPSDTVAPTTPSTTLSLHHSVLLGSGLITDGAITSDANPTLSGTGAEPGATIKIYDGLTLLGTTAVASDGSWSFSPSGELTNGLHSLTYTVTDASGNVSGASPAIAFTIDTLAPAAATGVSQQDTDGPANGITLSVTLPASGVASGDLITVVVKNATGDTVATTTYSLTPTDVANGSANPTVPVSAGT